MTDPRTDAGAAGGTPAPPAPPAPRTPAWNRLFAAAFGIYPLYSLAALAAGVLAALALPTGLHDTLHLWGFSRDLFGRTAEAIADAAHRPQPPLGLAIDYGFSLFNLALAALLIRLRPRDWTARLLAAGMVGTAAIFNVQAYGVYEAMVPTLFDDVAHDLFHLIAAGSYGLALLLFPDSRLVPRWRWPAPLVLYVPVLIAITVLALRIEGTSRTLVLVMVFGILTPVIGLGAQAYRYGRSPTAVERQQARLVFWALIPAFLLSVIVVAGGLTESAFTAFEGRGIEIIPVELFRVFQPIFAIIPVALLVGILKFRLWDVDRLIRRTLVYGALAGFISVVYVGVVVGIGQAIGTQSDNVLLAIVATGIVAVAFQPVKERVQHLANRLVYGRRTTPYEALSTFSKGMGDTVATEEKLSRLARILAEGTAARSVKVWLAVGDELRPAASWPQDRVEDPPSAIALSGEGLPPLGHGTVAVPVLHDGELLGALAVTKPVNEPLDPNEEKVIADLAAQAGLVLRNVRLTAELLDRLKDLRASRQRLLAAQDEARRRLERNLHDGAQQQLVSLKVRLALAEKMAEQGKPVAEILHQLAVDTGEAIDTLRDLARGIYPPLLAAEGLPAALRAQARKTPLAVAVEAEGIGRYSQDVEAAVYFCCLEALQNITKYAEAHEAVIALREEDGTLAFRVSDDGQGFDPAGAWSGAGLQNMADRVDALDGALEVIAAPGSGATTTGRIPMYLASSATADTPLPEPIAQELAETVRGSQESPRA
ncbi:MAG: hypothetical protein GEU81_13650 [Nitriliruptorales bacterium]|nr:hypothetical protein [Nitriliruptorales bacterium]